MLKRKTSTSMLLLHSLLSGASAACSRNRHCRSCFHTRLENEVISNASPAIAARLMFEFAQRSGLSPVAQSPRRWVVLLSKSLMASWSAVQVPSTPKTQAPVLPEPGLSCGRLWLDKAQQGSAGFGDSEETNPSCLPARIGSLGRSAIERVRRKVEMRSEVFWRWRHSGRPPQDPPRR
jgi:hypothetical protein